MKKKVSFNILIRSGGIYMVVVRWMFVWFLCVPASQVAYSESPPVYLGMSLELLWAVWSQFSVRYFLVPAVVVPAYTVAPQMHSLSLTAGF